MTVDRSDREEPARTTGAGYPPMPTPMPTATSVWETGPAPTAVVDRRRWSRRTHRWIIALYGLCVVLASIVFFAGDTYYLVDRVLPPMFWFFTVALVLNVATWYDDHRGQPRWGLPGLLAVLVVLLGIGAQMVHSANPAAVSSARSPDGRITALVREGTPVIVHPMRLVIVHQNAGLLSRTWTVGCVQADGPNAYEGVAWLDATTLEVRTKNGQRVRASLDPTGRPLKRLSTPDDTCP